MKIASYLNVNGFNIKPLNYRKLLPDLKIIRFERQISIAAYFNIHGIKIVPLTYWVPEPNDLQRMPSYYVPMNYIEPLPLDSRTMKILTDAVSYYNELIDRFKIEPIIQFKDMINYTDEKYYLSTEPYYFIYRPDKNDPNIKRATLFDGDRQVDDICCSNCNHGIPERDHHQVINYFEARLTLKFIK